jgi:hypothetical protein
MATPPTGDAQFRNDVITIAELTVTGTELEDLTFSNCRILGPAVLVARETQFIECTWETPDINALFWLIEPGRDVVLGAVGLTRCVFSKCSFHSIGLAGPAEMREVLEGGATQGP